MSDYAAPSGPPPPRVPEGWKAVWNDQYKEWFYVNLHTKQSSWEKPTEPAFGGNDAPLSGAPPSYSGGPNAPAHAGTDVKKTADSHDPYQQNVAESDEAYARRLQEQENQRANASRGNNDGYYAHDQGGYGQQNQSTGGYGQQNQSTGGYGQQNQSYSQTPSQPAYSASSSGIGQTKGSSGGGLFGKLKDKLASSGGQRPMGGGYGQQSYGHQQYPQQGYGYPQQGYPQQGYGYPQQGYGYGQPGMMQHKKKSNMPMMAAAGAGGLVGGMLLADAFDDDHDGGDYGGGDDGGDGGGD